MPSWSCCWPVPSGKQPLKRDLFLIVTLPCGAGSLQLFFLVYFWRFFLPPLHCFNKFYKQLHYRPKASVSETPCPTWKLSHTEDTQTGMGLGGFFLGLASDDWFFYLSLVLNSTKCQIIPLASPFKLWWREFSNYGWPASPRIFQASFALSSAVFPKPVHLLSVQVLHWGLAPAYLAEPLQF